MQPAASWLLPFSLGTFLVCAPQHWAKCEDDGSPREKPYPTTFDGDSSEVRARVIKFLRWILEGAPGLPKDGRSKNEDGSMVRCGGDACQGPGPVLCWHDSHPPHTPSPAVTVAQSPSGVRQLRAALVIMVNMGNSCWDPTRDATFNTLCKSITKKSWAGKSVGLTDPQHHTSAETVDAMQLATLSEVGGMRGHCFCDGHGCICSDGCTPLPQQRPCCSRTAKGQLLAAALSRAWALCAQYLLESATAASERDLALLLWMCSSISRSDDARHVKLATLCSPTRLDMIGGFEWCML